MTDSTGAVQPHDETQQAALSPNYRWFAGGDIIVQATEWQHGTLRGFTPQMVFVYSGCLTEMPPGKEAFTDLTSERLAEMIAKGQLQCIT